MGTKIGKPLTEVIGQPRVLPKTLPRPELVPEKEPVKEREKLPVEAIVARAEAATGHVITRLAKFLGITEQQVVDPIITLIDRVTRGIKRLTPPLVKTPSP
ncbi:hypothetical protein LCGC14_0289410 [marine sediment metagenome]|uniref:Uncharacterized protein n=1 Tax=marine sediment metagenome TaxID=412755 RepID=A0A0F9TYT8_9ZZZZ